MASFEYEVRQLIESAKRKIHDARHEMDRAAEKFEDKTDDILRDLGNEVQRLAEREEERLKKG
jgi:vacuolar-type H+-ATPase subunit H